MIGLVIFLSGAAGVGLALLLPKQFTATTTFASEDSGEGIGLPTAIAGLAAQLGVGISGGSTSPDFYADLLRSRPVLDSTLLAEFEVPGTPDQRSPLLDVLDIRRDSSEAQRLERGRRWLLKHLDSRVDPVTSVVTFRVTLGSPQLAADVAAFMVGQVEYFNLDRRQLRARRRREFIEERLDTATTELTRQESALQQFLEMNRSFETSSQLRFEYERFEYLVAEKRSVVSTLRTEYEGSRIAEVDDTPLITVIEPPVPPYRKSRPRRVAIVVASLLVGSLVAFLSAFALEYRDTVDGPKERSTVPE